jgi:hypothetical protein
MSTLRKKAAGFVERKRKKARFYCRVERKRCVIMDIRFRDEVPRDHEKGWEIVKNRMLEKR